MAEDLGPGAGVQAVDDGSGNLVDRRNLRTAAWGGLIGTALEQYDFVIYGTATAIIFNKIFFTQADPAIGVLAGFATYAVGFLARPLGGLFFSRYGDRLGRKFVLVATLFLMGISTFLIGALPTYEQVGVFAPALLVVLRLLQGLARHEGVIGDRDRPAPAVAMAAGKSLQLFEVGAFDSGLGLQYPRGGGQRILVGIRVHEASRQRPFSEMRWTGSL